MKSKIQVLKQIDALIGTPAVYLLRVIRPRNAGSFDDESLANPIPEKQYNHLKILVIRPGGIGDAVLLYPALRMLNEQYQGCMIDVLAEKRNAGIFEKCDLIHELILYDKSPVNSLLKIYKNRYDVVIDTEQWHRLSAVIAYLTRAPIRIGFNTNDRSKLFTRKVDYSHDDYESVSFLNLVSSLSQNKHEFDVDKSFLSLPKDINTRKLDELNEYADRWPNTVGIFCGATVRERIWGTDNFLELAKYLIENNIGVVILGGSSEVADSYRIAKSVGEEKVLNFAGKTSLLQTALIISKLDIFISADTGLMHIAYALGTATASLFGAGIEAKWGPKGKRNIILNKNLPCSPCTKFGYTPACRIDVKCLRDISVSEVSKAVTSLLNIPFS